MWWRDDDATAASPALDRLLDLAAGHACPILVAAIPARIEPSLGGRLQGTGARLAVHGLCHANHAPAGEKPSEFGPHRPLAVLRADAARALTLARERLPADILLPVFVPPWNRLAPDLADALPDLGYRGLSAGDARAPAVPGLVRADAWLDPIDWRRTRSLADPDRLVETLLRWLGAADRPLGLLTHHLAHDAAVWDFLERLLTLLLRHGAVRPLDPRDLFGASPVDAGAATCPMSGQRADVRARPA